MAEGFAAWDVELAPEERHRLIERIADAVMRRGMATPAILFLEMHKPVSFFASQGLIVLSPFIAPLVGFENCRTATRLLEDRANVELLIRRIEDRAVEQDTARRANRRGAKPHEGESA